MDPDLGLHCLLERFQKHFSRRPKQTTFVVIGVLREIRLHCYFHLHVLTVVLFLTGSAFLDPNEESVV